VIVVIQCAGSKRADAGTLRTKDGKPVKFVARPDLAPEDGFAYARPDDLSDQRASWRDLLLRYNEDTGDNRLGLLPACELYTPAIYQQLADSVGRHRLFILSAGWGMIGADYLTPDYDITFSAAARGADSFKRRKNGDGYADFSMLPKDTTEKILFFGGNDYLPHFLALTSGLSAPRTIFYASASIPDVPGCTPVRFETTRRTNWHYSCADAFLDGTLTYAAQ
tara:strand:+ start:21862 stop:22530 length:669 start_codon:yes stop_codon:yes gene_type:complete